MSWLDRLRGRHPQRIDPATWQQACAQVPLAHAMSAPHRERLRTIAGYFLAHKHLHGAGSFDINDHQRMLIAVQACVPLLMLGERALRGWSDVIVYPGRFKVRRQRHLAGGVITESDDVLIGEAWERGPLILSWADIEHDLAHPWDGYNVVVHEMAHKLDMLDGGTDGVPLLPRQVSRKRWIETFQHAYDRLATLVRAGQPTHIDPYAAENPQEFFAVVSELHFSAPHRLRQHEPGVAELLHGYYGPSPAPL
ncbi:M90 family metallopeptidase [Oleiagrimonas sp. C23AA]|uniref:M90 family metallopeptidase n=1 Tax=Oleiagrimonas sp. C23AA TaxID=2719047 RepID=UPI001421EA17|nr:M90 family metallopeptidase [Oleiagrimonas sp. C23AA]NII11878.1 zinc-dependent peptidase [Oleiagrimonas sp. C23AA]